PNRRSGHYLNKRRRTVGVEKPISRPSQKAVDTLSGSKIPPSQVKNRRERSTGSPAERHRPAAELVKSNVHPHEWRPPDEYVGHMAFRGLRAGGYSQADRNSHQKSYSHAHPSDGRCEKHEPAGSFRIRMRIVQSRPRQSQLVPGYGLATTIEVPLLSPS